MTDEDVLASKGYTWTMVGTVVRPRRPKWLWRIAWHLGTKIARWYWVRVK